MSGRTGTTPGANGARVIESSPQLGSVERTTCDCPGGHLDRFHTLNTAEKARRLMHMKSPHGCKCDMCPFWFLTQNSYWTHREKIHVRRPPPLLRGGWNPEEVIPVGSTVVLADGQLTVNVEPGVPFDAPPQREGTEEALRAEISRLRAENSWLREELAAGRN